MERKLVAILSVDVVGYTRLMEIDEAGTLTRLKSLRQRLIDPLIAGKGGRIVKLMGDGALVEFPSVVAAVDCALSIQRDMAGAEPDVPEADRIRFRIGINVGDVIVDGDDIYGEGVNVAARLQALAEPGGIAVSGAVRDHVGSKLAAVFEDFGAHTVKNLEKPVRVYRVQPGKLTVAGEPEAKPPASTADKLSVAVLPFVNLSNDAEQEYFADGITEDIITELSRFKRLFVIARNSSFRYKGQPVRIQDVGRDLGVRWVVEGSVRKMGNRVRITAQLIDATTGAHLWAERYDRALEDIFSAQDEVVRAIAAAIPGHVGRAAVERVQRRPPANLSAFDHFLKALWAQQGNDTYGEMIGHLERAIEADPSYALAHARLARAYTYSIYFSGLDPEMAIARGAHHAASALKLDDGDSEVHAAAAANYILSGNHELADQHSRRAVELNPNDPIAIHERGLVLCYLGHQSEAREFFGRAEKLDPSTMDKGRNEPLCDSLFMSGEYEKLLDILRRWHDVPIHMKLEEAAAYAMLGRTDESKMALEEFDHSPGPKPDAQVMVKYQMRMLARQEDRDRWLEGYRKAGLDV